MCPFLLTKLRKHTEMCHDCQMLCKNFYLENKLLLLQERYIIFAVWLKQSTNSFGENVDTLHSTLTDDCTDKIYHRLYSALIAYLTLQMKFSNHAK